MSLAALEDEFEAATRRIPVAKLPQLWLNNGYYTLTFPCGSHRTIRIHTQREGAIRGRRILSLLIGPDNTSDYEGFGELTDDTPEGYRIWKRWKDAPQARYAAILVLLAQGDELDGHSLKVARHCFRCNKLLTTEESIEAGIGPECAKREVRGR